nr:unnamed protein product [Callosobruchus analis]
MIEKKETVEETLLQLPYLLSYNSGICCRHSAPSNFETILQHLSASGLREKRERQRRFCAEKMFPGSDERERERERERDRLKSVFL